MNKGLLFHFFAALTGCAALIFTILGPFAWLVLLTDGCYAAAILLAAAGWGAWAVVLLQQHRRPALQQVLLAVALGAGILSLLVLALGVAGGLSHSVAVGILLVGAALGIARIYHAQPFGGASRSMASATLTLRERLLPVAAGAILAIPVAVMLSGACLPPTVLWRGEAGGYDALEYHLQAPREWLAAGKIEFLPHNVYACFPQQVEMQYLLLMRLVGDPHAAAIPCQILHAFYGVLTIVALGAWRMRPGPKIAAMLIAGTVPWLAYVGCLAYVENGMLFYTAIAGGLALECIEAGAFSVRTVVAAGICAGLAAGCKYQGIVFVVVALWIAILAAHSGSVAKRLAASGCFLLAALGSFSPWLVRNTAFTGNPVYPFAYAIFDGRDWSAAQAEQWRRGHAVPARENSVGGRLRIAAHELAGYGEAWSRVPNSPQFGAAILALALASIAIRRTRAALFLALWSALIFAGWIGLTHIPGRFAMPLIVPLALLAAQLFEPGAGEPGRFSVRSAVGGGVLLVGAAAMSCLTLGLYWGESWRFFNSYQVPMSAVFGRTAEILGSNTINRVVTESGNAWLVGDAAVFPLRGRMHYTVVFNRDPWLEFCAGHESPAECVGWLRERGITHVVFNWPEINRLRSTYGFDPRVTREWVERLAGGGLRPTGEDISEPRVTGLAIYEVARR